MTRPVEPGLITLAVLQHSKLEIIAQNLYCHQYGSSASNSAGMTKMKKVSDLRLGIFDISKWFIGHDRQLYQPGQLDCGSLPVPHRR
jgi:hypothetical protein